MAFPFNLLAVRWTSPAIPEWLAGLCDELPLVREEAFEQLAEGLAEGSPDAARVAEPLLKLVETEGAKGRGLAAVLLGHLAFEGRSTELLEQLKEEKAVLETLTTRHSAATPLGAALRVITTVLAAPPGSQFVDQLAAVETLVLQADEKDEAPPPTKAQVKEWVGRGPAVALALRALPVDAEGALAILRADRTEPTTALQQVNRAVLEARCREKLGQPVSFAGTWSRTAQALLLEAAERVPAPVGAAILSVVDDPSHAVRKRFVEVKVKHAAGDASARARAEALAAEWLQPAKAGGVNQVLSKGELIGLMKAVGAPCDAIEAAGTPEIALPEGDTL